MKAEKFTSMIFLCVVMTFMISIFCILALNISKKLLHTQETIWLNIDWESLYPFEKRGEESQVETTSSIYNIKVKVENYTSINLPYYYSIIETARKYEGLIGWNMSSILDYNAINKLDDGYLANYTVSCDVGADAVSIKEFSDFCTEKGIDFMYINFPTKVCFSEDREISGTLDFANQNADRFLSILKESGVKCYDFRKILHNEGKKHHEAFFIADFHWKPETGLWAARHILEFIHDDWGWPVSPDIITPEQFNYVVYPKWFLGSQGKKLTLSRSQPEDFTLIYPKFETHIKFEVPNAEVNAEGNFSIIYNMKEIEPKDYYNKSPYAAYIYATRPMTRLENKLVRNGKRLLMIRDSLSHCVIPFMALSIQYIDVLDRRNFNGSIKNFIEREKPDAVIVVYNSGVPGKSKDPYSRAYERSFFDFR